MNLNLYTIENAYIEYLRGYEKLANVFDNKELEDSKCRKYLGVVLSIGKYRYYAPLSSPKSSDYIISGEEKVIRKSIIPIIRITGKGKDGKTELKGTLKLSNMIPVPDNVITYYDVAKETDRDYKILIQKEYDFIKKNEKKVIKYSHVLYNQKTKENKIFTEGKKPKYLEEVVDFRFAEQISEKYNLSGEK